MDLKEKLTVAEAATAHARVCAWRIQEINNAQVSIPTSDREAAHEAYDAACIAELVAWGSLEECAGDSLPEE